MVAEMEMSFMLWSKCMKEERVFDLSSAENEKGNGAQREVKATDLLWLFVGGSVVGFILEGLWHILRTGTWESHTATVWGPFCLIYGIANVLAYVLSSRIGQKSLLIQFLIYGGIGSGIEYFGSLFQELFFGFSSWDYSHHFLNIGGRISIWMTFLWGALGIFFAKCLFPLFKKVLHKMKGNAWNIASIVVAVFMSVNLVFTAMTVLRWSERQEDLPASNVWEEYADEKYDDERMQDIFPNWFVSGSK
jgi:uncharacterized membrane protein